MLCCALPPWPALGGGEMDAVICEKIKSYHAGRAMDALDLSMVVFRDASAYGAESCAEAIRSDCAEPGAGA